MLEYPLVAKLFAAANLRVVRAVSGDFYMVFPLKGETSIACLSPSAIRKMEDHLNLLTAPKADSSL